MKGLRQERSLSQEQLAELSGLSLRTIQRIEGRQIASPETLSALAAAFEIDGVALQRELSMDKTSIEWKKRPVWVRGLFFGSGRIKMDRRQHKIVELISVVAGLTFILAGYMSSASVATPLLLSGSLLILGAYLMSVSTRIGDEYSVWSWIG